MYQSALATTDDDAQDETNANEKLANLTDDLEDVAERVEDLDEEDVENAHDGALAELRGAIRRAEDTEDVRKDVVESEMKDRTEIGGDLCGLRRVESERRYVADEAAAIQALVEEGVSLWRVFDMDRKALENAAEENEIDVDSAIGSHTYDYFQS